MPHDKPKMCEAFVQAGLRSIHSHVEKEHAFRSAMRRCEVPIDNTMIIRRKAFNVLDVRKLRHPLPLVQYAGAYRKTSGVLRIFRGIKVFVPAGSVSNRLGESAEAGGLSSC
ncbi:hypothetical protein [Paraburkholderia solisilvae]|uniref:hypothetical protein n=1 Tax=Paraburkholderia solisilvae TaxID=624376 RepID=UPI001581A9EE|nr:hypothetical protein [Paraburkholderia solisilvae]